MLVQICEFIRREKTVSLQQLTRKFCIDAQALEPMLSLWMRKGVIQLQPETTACKARCSRCNVTQNPIYQYVKGRL